jgi:tripartite-type tricarboxylate transporter receptor subunit TctC
MKLAEEGMAIVELPHRRQFLQLAAGAAALPAIPHVARAQSYPSRPVTLVVPIAAGGGLDTTARILAEKLQDNLKQPFVVENRPGAGSTVGTNLVAKAKPDGYTLLLMEVSAVWAKWLTKNAPFDVTGDFTPIAMVATTPLVLFAHPSFAVNDVKELIAYSKANPGKLSVGTAGVSTPHHLAAAWLNTAAKIDITHVPYRGAAPALNDLLGGQIPLMWATPVAVMPFVEQGKAKVLGVATQQRISMLPQVPTVAESAVPGFAVEIWLGIAAPANVPPEVVARVGQAIHEATELPEVQKRMSTLGLYVDFRNSEQFHELIVREHQKYGTIIREAGIQPE